MASFKFAVSGLEIAACHRLRVPSPSQLLHQWSQTHPSITCQLHNDGELKIHMALILPSPSLSEGEMESVFFPPSPTRFSSVLISHTAQTRADSRGSRRTEEEEEEEEAARAHSTEAL